LTTSVVGNVEKDAVMSQQSERVTFCLFSPAMRAWVVLKAEHRQTYVIEMTKEYANRWSASKELPAGEYLCRFYCGTERNTVVFHGPANINGIADYGIDRTFSIQIAQQEIAPSAVNILLVEDQLDTLEACARLLRMDGHVVFTADGYRAALQVAEKEQLDLAICDIGLWDGDGCELLKQLRRLQPLNAIAVTGHTLEQEAAQYLDAGFAAVLWKPLQHSNLADAIFELNQMGQHG
jgi:CheY-like chemotaxis protein